MVWRFLVVGGLGFLVDVALTYLFISLGAGPVVARMPAIAGAMTFTWLANRLFTFGPSSRQPAGEFARYAAVALTASALNFLVYSACIFAGLPPVAAIAVASVIQAGLSYFGFRRWVFGSPKD